MATKRQQANSNTEARTHAEEDSPSMSAAGGEQSSMPKATIDKCKVNADGKGTPVPIDQQSPLFKLPPELRNSIYDLAFLDERVILLSDWKRHPRPALLRVCKQITAEATKLYFSQVSVRIPELYGWGGRFVAWFKALGKDICRELQWVEVCAKMIEIIDQGASVIFSYFLWELDTDDSKWMISQLVYSGVRAQVVTGCRKVDDSSMEDCKWQEDSQRVRSVNERIQTFAAGIEESLA